MSCCQYCGNQCIFQWRSHEEHQICGSVLKLDSLVRFREVQIIVKGKEETALVVYWVTDGVDCCHVGFLPRHMVRYREAYDGQLAQVVEFLSELNIHDICARNHCGWGVCQAVLVEVVKTPPRKW